MAKYGQKRCPLAGKNLSAGKKIVMVLASLLIAACLGCGGAGGQAGSVVAATSSNISSANSTFTVTYNGNGSTIGNVAVDSTRYAQGQTVTVLGNTGNLAMTGYYFAGWNTNADDSGTAYSPGAAFQMGASNVTLYAVWTKLLQQSALTYEGAFQVPRENTGCGGSYSPGNIAYNAIDNSLFITGGTVDTGCTGGQVGEISIPAALSNTTTSSYGGIPATTFLQVYSDITDGNIFNNAPYGTKDTGSLLFQGGIMLFDNNSKLLESSGSHYDTNPDTNEFLPFAVHDTVVADNSFSGMYGLNISSDMGTDVTERDSNVFLGSIPTDFQAQLGGSAFGGGGGYSVISASSYGPSFVVFNPGSLGTADAGSPPPDNRGTATALLYYPVGKTPAGWGNWGSNTNYYGTSDNVTGATFINGTDTVLFFGIHSTGACIPKSGASPASTADCATPLGNGNPSDFGGYCYGLGTSVLGQQCNGGNGGSWGPSCVNGNPCGANTLIEQGPGGENDTCCYDPAGSAKGQHEYPYVAHVWAYDVGLSTGSNSTGNNVKSNISNSAAPSGTAGNNPNENNLTAVKLGKLYPNDLYPYAMWQITLPWLPASYDANISPAYDPANKKLYLSFSDQPTGTYNRMPVVAVFDVRP